MLMTRWQVSIHAPAWGATVADDIDRVVQKVSIHAPAWGATQSRQGCYPIYPSFNPRARVGRDAHATKFIESLEEFQSTRPRGARLKSGDALEILEQFQSTRPRGARPIADKYTSALSIVSIHAPAWGATDPPKVLLICSTVSIHAPAWGATHG